MFRSLLMTLFIGSLVFSGCSMKEYTLFQDEDRSEEPTDVNDTVYQNEMVFENKIQPNDRVEIMVYNQSSAGPGQLTSMISLDDLGGGARTADETRGMLVTQEGTVRLPLIGSVNLWGYTEDEATRYLMDEYGKYLRSPYVTLKIMNQRLFILGEVNTPGVVPITNGTISIIEAIARSGDIKIASLYLKPNDIVYVQPRSSKGRTIAYEEIAPPFRLISDILSPFVSITYLTEAWRD
jgi:polysaccharide export outer membrane protein